MKHLIAYRSNYAFALLLLGITLASMPTKASRPIWQGVEIHHFAQARSDPLCILAIGQGILYRSSDGGKSWVPLRVPISQGLTIEWADVHPLDHRRLIVLARDQSSSRQHLFYESMDEGKSWRSQTPYTIDLPKPFPDSNVTPRLLRHSAMPTNSRLTWSQPLIDTGYSIANNVVQIAGKSYFLSDRTLWAAENDERWVIRYQFPPADAASRRYTYSNLLALDNSVLVVRQPKGTWLQSTDEGYSWPESSEVFQALNARLAQETLANSPPGNGDTRCRVQVSPANQQVLVATCVWDNGALPSRTCLHHSVDGGNSWMPPLNSTSKRGDACPGVGLPGGWAPRALLLDKFDPKKMVIAWMAGGVFRAEDGGQRWTSSDQGLRFRERDGGRFDFIAMAEPLSIRAVLYRDLEYLDQLITQGASINEPGNGLSGVLDAELTVLEDERAVQPKHSLWAELRKRGASVNPPEGRRSNLLKRALSRSAPEIVSDLISEGYDWGRPSDDFKMGDSISTEIESLVSSADPVKRQVLESILKTYIQADKFPAADVTVQELLRNNEHSNAIRILRAATLKVALDKQSTPPRVDRLQLAALLVQANEPTWARRLFLAAKQEKQLVFSEGYWALAEAIGGSCNPKEAAWFVAQGMRNVWLADCLSEVAFPSESARMNILNYMVKSRSIDAENWNSFLQKSSHRWVRHTKHHRLFENELKFLPYAIVGIDLGGPAADSQVLGARSYVKVTGLRPGFSAKREGMRVGDEITHVDGKSTAGMQFYEVRKLLIGKVGTKVNVQIRRGDETRNFRLERESVEE